MHYTFQCVFSHCTFHVSLSFLSITLESRCCLSNDSSIIGYLNTHAAMVQNEEQYILSNIIYVKLRNLEKLIKKYLAMVFILLQSCKFTKNSLLYK